MILEFLKISDLHRERIVWVLSELTSITPITPKKAASFSPQELLLIEMLIGRFGKLQDYMGTKLMDAFLHVSGEEPSRLTVIDKLNRLERLGIIESTEIWTNMRNARNYTVHEYPDNPDVMARYLNQIILLTPVLLSYYETLKQKLLEISTTSVERSVNNQDNSSKN